MTDAIIVRPATTADLTAIGELWAGLVDYHRQLDPRLPAAAADGPRRYARRIEDRLDDSYTCTLVAERGGVIVGYVLGAIVDAMADFFQHEACGFVADIFVAPEARREGVGKLLMAHMVAWFRANGMDYYEWHVAAQNAAGLEFWRELGGETVLMRMRADVPPSDGGEEKP